MIKNGGTDFEKTLGAVLERMRDGDVNGGKIQLLQFLDRSGGQREGSWVRNLQSNEYQLEICLL